MSLCQTYAPSIPLIAMLILGPCFASFRMQRADGRKSAAIPCVFVSTGGTNGSLRNPIKDACSCSRMTQPAIRTAAAGNPSGSSMLILMGPMDRCYGDCLRPFWQKIFLCSSGLACPVMGSIPSLHRGRRKDAQMAFSTGLTPSIGQVPYDPIPKQLSHEALDTSGKGIPASLKVHPCQADGIPTSIPCKNEECSAAAGHPGCGAPGGRTF